MFMVFVLSFIAKGSFRLIGLIISRLTRKEPSLFFLIATTGGVPPVSMVSSPERLYPLDLSIARAILVSAIVQFFDRMYAVLHVR